MGGSQASPSIKITWGAFKALTAKVPFQLAKPASWAEPGTQKKRTFGLMICCHHLEILIIFQFHFAPDPAYDNQSCQWVQDGA